MGVSRREAQEGGDICIHARALGSIPGLGRSPGNPLPYSCLENPMDRGVWWVTVHGVTKSWTQLREWLSTHTRIADSCCCTAEK